MKNRGLSLQPTLPTWIKIPSRASGRSEISRILTTIFSSSVLITSSCFYDISTNFPQWAVVSIQLEAEENSSWSRTTPCNGNNNNNNNNNNSILSQSIEFSSRFPWFWFSSLLWSSTEPWRPSGCSNFQPPRTLLPCLPALVGPWFVHNNRKITAKLNF